MTTPVPPQDLAQLGFKRLQAERSRLDRIDDYINGKHDGPYVPRSATPEYKLLAQRSITNFLPLIVETPNDDEQGHARDLRLLRQWASGDALRGRGGARPRPDIGVRKAARRRARS